MCGGTSCSTGTEQRVMFQSLGPHNPTLAPNPAVLHTAQESLALDNAFVLIDGAPGTGRGSSGKHWILRARQCDWEWAVEIRLQRKAKTGTHLQERSGL